ncbi:unnamed protein product [Ceratitis capitata]|uniref:(Mediterranean fruit fly) hypothetical protein n=1 Tax=Ceratitis capitata TaxID=7213 RepID=A0A811UP79_CERCA|nr:unnamed protein product [Ceratitis capitata]
MVLPSGSRSCSSFYYYGCGGNANRYCSLGACQQRCTPRGIWIHLVVPSVELRKEEKRLVRYRCGHFVFNFQNEYFRSYGGRAQAFSGPNRYYSCSGGYHSGHGGSGCYAGTRWYYNSRNDECYSFYYYGCGGNANRYCSLSACQNNYNPTCTEPRNPGFNGDRCNGGTRWYYNSGSRQCESFFYWGCGGNSNRYCSLFACQQRCRIIFNP